MTGNYEAVWRIKGKDHPRSLESVEELAFMAECRGELRWLPIKGPKCRWRSLNPKTRLDLRPGSIGQTADSLTSRTAVVRTRMPGGVTGKARECIPMSIRWF